MKGLSLHSEGIFEQVSKLDCVKNYTLIGGTALALQLGHRLSEDLDFCKWRKSKNAYGAADYTEHRLKTKNIIAMLVDSEYVKIDKQFQELNPIYNFDLTFLEKGISEKFKEMTM
jgi:hypothetical protein